jgi:hypothetical protein
MVFGPAFNPRYFLRQYIPVPRWKTSEPAKLYTVQASYRGEDTEAEEAGGEDTAVTEFVKSLESKARGRLRILSTHKIFFHDRKVIKFYCTNDASTSSPTLFDISMF